MAKKKVNKSKKVAKQKKATTKSNASGAKPKAKRSLKVPLIVAGSVVLAAGIVIGATFITLNVINSAPKPLVSEAEIDKYLLPPSGEVTPIDSSLVLKIKTDAIRNIESGNFKGAEIKNLSSYPFYTALTTGEHDETDYEITDANDLTGVFVTNKALKTKNLYATYVDMNLTTDADGIPCFVAKAIDENTKMIDGNAVKTKITTNQTFLAKKEAKGTGNSYQIFIKSFINYQGLEMPESFEKASGVTKDAAIAQLNHNAVSYVGNFTNFKSLERMTSFYTDGKGTVYCIAKTEETIDPITLSEDVVITPKMRNVDIWRFRQNKDYGWVLDSYATDGGSIYGETDSPDVVIPYAIYVDKNEHGEQLAKPFAVNKMKGFIKLSYGKRGTKDVSDINYVDDEAIWSYRDIEVDFGEESANYQEKTNYGISDITPYYRFDNPNFKGFKFSGTYFIDTGRQCILVSTSKHNPGDVKYLYYEDIVNKSEASFVVEGDLVAGTTDKHKMKFPTGCECYFDITLSKDGTYSMNLAEVR